MAQRASEDAGTGPVEEGVGAQAGGLDAKQRRADAESFLEAMGGKPIGEVVRAMLAFPDYPPLQQVCVLLHTPQDVGSSAAYNIATHYWLLSAHAAQAVSQRPALQQTRCAVLLAGGRGCD